jgi:hypothetical protein
VELWRHLKKLLRWKKTPLLWCRIDWNRLWAVMISVYTETVIVRNLQKKLLFCPVKSWAVSDVRMECVPGISKSVAVSSSGLHDSLITQTDFIAFTCCESLKSYLLQHFFFLRCLEVNHIMLWIKNEHRNRNLLYFAINKEFSTFITLLPPRRILQNTFLNDKLDLRFSQLWVRQKSKQCWQQAELLVSCSWNVCIFLPDYSVSHPGTQYAVLFLNGSFIFVCGFSVVKHLFFCNWDFRGSCFWTRWEVQSNSDIAQEICHALVTVR